MRQDTDEVQANRRISAERRTGFTRITGPNDYYLVRASADEQRVCIFRTVGGVSKEIAGVDADIARNHWQTLEVVARDSEFTIRLDEQWLLTAFDAASLSAGNSVSGPSGMK